MALPIADTGTTDAHPVPPTKAPQSLILELQTACSSKGLHRFEQALKLWHNLATNVFELDSVMMTAIEHNFADGTERLLLAGLPVHVDHALQAVHFKSLDALQILLDHGLDINKSLGTLKPPVLGYANDETVASWLLKHGADPNQQCFIDLTPLSLAIEAAPLNVVKLLLRHGNIQKGQLLHHAINRETDVVPVLQILLEKGATPSLNSTWYEHDYNSWRLFYFMGLGTPLHDAAEKGKLEVVHFLLSLGADATVRDAKERTAYRCAVESGHHDVAQVLQEALN